MTNGPNIFQMLLVIKSNDLKLLGLFIRSHNNCLLLIILKAFPLHVVGAVWFYVLYVVFLLRLLSIYITYIISCSNL